MQNPDDEARSNKEWQVETGHSGWFGTRSYEVWVKVTNRASGRSVRLEDRGAKTKSKNALVKEAKRQLNG